MSETVKPVGYFAGLQVGAGGQNPYLVPLIINDPNDSRLIKVLRFFDVQATGTVSLVVQYNLILIPPPIIGGTSGVVLKPAYNVAVGNTYVDSACLALVDQFYLARLSSNNPSYGWVQFQRSDQAAWVGGEFQGKAVYV